MPCDPFNIMSYDPLVHAAQIGLNTVGFRLVEDGLIGPSTRNALTVWKTPLVVEAGEPQIKDGWLNIAKKDLIVGGSNTNDLRFLVLHFTAGATAKSSIQSMRSQGLAVQLVLDRDGTLYQCRSFGTTAGHAGKSTWKGVSGLNNFSIGIEIANGGDSFPTKFSNLPPVVAAHKNGGPVREWEQYTPEQISTLLWLCPLLVRTYKLQDVVGHDDIAPDRKADPGPAFPMQIIREVCGFPGLPKQ